MGPFRAMKVLGILPIPWDSAPNGGLCPWCWYPTGPSWCWTVCPSCMVREGLSFHPPGFKSWRPHGPGHSVDSPYLLHLLSPEPFVRDCSRRGQVSGQQRPAICSGASPSSPWFRAFWAWPAARNPCVSSTASGNRHTVLFMTPGHSLTSFPRGIPSGTPDLRGLVYTHGWSTLPWTYLIPSAQVATWFPLTPGRCPNSVSTCWCWVGDPLEGLRP